MDDKQKALIAAHRAVLALGGEVTSQIEMRQVEAMKLIIQSLDLSING